LGSQPELAEQPDQERRRSRSVDVVIAEDGDRLARLDGIGETFGGIVHVAGRWKDRA
jgi:hypothetical protein